MVLPYMKSFFLIFFLFVVDYMKSLMQPLKITCLLSLHSLKKYAYYLVVSKARYKTAYILGISPVICVVLCILGINI